ncbi:MAG: NAD(P)H-hydrate dehydratase [Desulfobacterales bacterium]|jgi:NAD(P)H-hydrate epimerase|nr:NAD(P)H-hydrate dehydratase [Desulfobacterales bacterium]
MILVTSAEMQTLDRLTIEVFGLPGRVLMENAGREAARVLLANFAEAARGGVGIAAGCGNNGGDGFVVARCLAQQGYPVQVFLLGAAERLQGDAAANLALLRPLGVPVAEIREAATLQALQQETDRPALWVDALLGTGLNADVRGVYRDLIERINRSGRPVLSVDIPSGVSADTGRVCGAAVRATVTVAFGFAKIGHALLPGAELAGRLEVVDIGIPAHLLPQAAPRHQLLTDALARAALTRRPADAHKGLTGHLLLLAGAPGKTGAAALAAESALRVGAGLVTLGVGASLNPVMETATLEAMTAPLAEAAPGILGPAALEETLALARGKSCLAIGPGLGPADATGELVRAAVRKSPCPLVIDADGLNHLAGRLECLENLSVPAVITPHPGEMARLLGVTTEAVQQDRIGCARNLAASLKIHVVLKGARTVIAQPDAAVFVNPTGNPGMASGGMGDVLTGAVAGLISQGVAPGRAACTAVYLHGAAADWLAQNVGPRGFLAAEVMRRLPAEIARLQGEGR